MKQVTLLYLRRGDQILLAMKKRGFGAGKWNGVGGKVEPGESIVQATARECREEIGVVPQDIQQAGELDFRLNGSRSVRHYVHIFTTGVWAGELHETGEMRPRWFKTNAIPYDKMWPGDRLWLGLVLAGKHFRGDIVMDDEQTVAHANITELVNIVQS